MPLSNLDVYRKARRFGLQYNLNNPGQTDLPVLETMAAENRRSGELSLGLREVPLSKVRGTAFAARSQAFAGNFMPLLPSTSEFACKWAALYEIHETEGIRDAVTVLEYLGFYYVIEGNKRVSVLKYADFYSVLCDVTRVLPDWNADDPDIAIFREMFDGNNRVTVGHLWFSTPGRYPVLWDGARKQTLARGLSPDETESVLHEAFWRFRTLYHAMGLSELSLTTGDAFYFFCEVYGFPPLRLPEEEYKRRMRHMRAQWYFVQGGCPDMVVEEPHAPSSPKSKETHICLVEDSLSATMHTYALHALMRYATIIPISQSASPSEEGYETLFALCRNNRFDHVFMVGQTLSSHAWRLQIDFPDICVALCTPHCDPCRLVNTYWGCTEQAAFVGGTLAGSLSRTDRMAFAGDASKESERNVRLFAEGARLVNPRAEILWVTQTPDATLLPFLAGEQADIVWLPSPSPLPGVQAPFPDIWAYLYTLSAQATLQDCLGGAVWNWEVLYAQMAQAADTRAAPWDWRLGLSEGLVDFIPFTASLRPHSLVLLQAVHQLLALPDPPCNTLSETLPDYITAVPGTNSV